MNKIYRILLIGFLLIGCKEKTVDKKITEKKTEFNQELANELKEMAKIDQIAAYIPQGEYNKLSQEEWASFKDSVFTTNQKRVKEIFDQYGFVGFDLAKKKGSQNFWFIVQHSDHNPKFQRVILEKMKIEVDKENAESSSYGLLVDRLKLNTGQMQVYGTQVAYNSKTGQAYARKLADSLTVNKRRKSIGLEPIKTYLNDMSVMHFEMNKKSYLEKGITEAKLYKIE